MVLPVAVTLRLRVTLGKVRPLKVSLLYVAAVLMVRLPVTEVVNVSRPRKSRVNWVVVPSRSRRVAMPQQL